MFYKKKIVLTEESGKVYQTVDVKSDGAFLTVTASACKENVELALFTRNKLIFCGKMPVEYKLSDWSGEEIHVGVLSGNRVLATGSTEGNHYSHLFTRERETTKDKKTSPPPIETDSKKNRQQSEQELKHDSLEDKIVENKSVNESSNEIVEEKKPATERKHPSSAKKEVHEFYCSIKQNLDEMFVCYPREEKLCSLIEDSEWVKVERSDGYYAVGLIKNDGAPEYVCYGVPGTRDLLPPDNLKKYCQWIPLSDSDDDGYWMVFQDAKTGIAIENN